MDVMERKNKEHFSCLVCSAVTLEAKDVPRNCFYHLVTASHGRELRNERDCQGEDMFDRAPSMLMSELSAHQKEQDTDLPALHHPIPAPRCGHRLTGALTQKRGGLVWGWDAFVEQHTNKNMVLWDCEDS